MSRRLSLTTLEFNNKFNEVVLNQNSSTNQIQRKIAKRALKQIIENDITERQKEVLILYYYENKNIPQIAKTLEVNNSTVARTLERARKNILDKMKYYF